MGNLSGFTSLIPMAVWFVLSGLVTYLLRQQDNRINTLEKRMLDVQTQTEVRDMMQDNITPIRTDINEIKQRLNQLFQLALDNKTRGE